MRRRVVRIEEVGGDSVVFHYDDDGEPETFDAKNAVLVTRLAQPDGRFDDHSSCQPSIPLEEHVSPTVGVRGRLGARVRARSAFRDG